jgi:rRNA-processing protein FCF1
MAEQGDGFDIFALERVFPNADALFSLNIEPLESVREKCDIVLDTNVLLLPYATGPNSLKRIQTIYERLKTEGRFFIPSQVAREFARHRANKLMEVLKTLADKRSQIQKPSIRPYPLLEKETSSNSLCPWPSW